MLSENRVDQWAGFAVVLVLILGCFVVLRPFLSAILWSVILAFSTWPVYQRIESAVAGRKGLASGLMVLIVAAVLIVPLALLGTSLAEDVTALVEMARQLLSEGPPTPPAWVAKLPVVGSRLHDHWQEMAGSGARLTEALLKYLMPLRDWALRSAANFGESLLYLSLSVFIAFFLYRDGAALSTRLAPLFTRVGGQRAPALLHVAGDTIKGVVYGVIGTALIQGILVGIGLWIAGIPRVLLLGVLACVLSLIPVGPALIWLPAAIWLFGKGSTGWAVFLVLWGLLVVGLVDNFLKPYFIGKGSHLPFILVFLGTLGGVMAFGFLGIFLGPTLLAIAYASFQEWSARERALS
ncbi:MULTISPECIES: AI-2E family transporter [Methylocaldum]|uniref:AI-2E family transporter n=1 Tax=unclassified Methylocaldum TaxID=2622260 RepID=UPI00098A9AE4|nr:AI-2E family transporter [Methylocaldum sp. 14B]MVF23320.1 AI-2E family transporter [Methylocaldum sp. BRCS4]